MSDDQWLIQVSPKLPDGTLVNIRGRNGDEFQRLLDWVTENAQAVVSVAAGLQGAYNIVAPGAGQSAPPPQSQGFGGQQQAASPPPQQSGPPAPTCQHGEMQFRQSKPGAAKQWKAYFCPTPQGTPNQCEPQWLGR